MQEEDKERRRKNPVGLIDKCVEKRKEDGWDENSNLKHTE